MWDGSSSVMGKPSGVKTARIEQTRGLPICNQCLDTASSYEYIDPGIENYRDTKANWLSYTDGACRKNGAPAYSWIVYAVFGVGSEWMSFSVAFGYQWISQDQSSFIVEAQGIDRGLEVTCNITKAHSYDS